MIRRLETAVFDGRVSDVIAWVAFLGGIIAYPITALTVFADEPQGILGLSWGAIIYTGYQILAQNHTHRTIIEQDSNES